MAPSIVASNGASNNEHVLVTEPSKSHAKDVYSSGTLKGEDNNNQRLGGMGRAKDGRQLKVRSYPKFDSLEEERLYRKQHLAAAYRVFANCVYDEGVAGHISVRDPILTDHFWLNPLSKHFSEICVSDLILVDEDGQVVVGDEPINVAAFAIHSEIHKARPDVHAACHAHSIYGKAFLVFGRKLDIMTQDSTRFWKSHSVYPQFGGVVFDREEGKRIAQHLGDGKAIILQNHGLLTVGETVDAAAFYFISMDKACQVQLLVEAAEQRSGHKKTIVSDEEAEYSYAQTGSQAKGWLHFQPYYDQILAKTKRSFLR
ncbi:hypothetical protein M409DRAFT_68412 [Zasmidium cellare ATCC 36951]|uniref:Class II aldolase/adducin N-terminal domain-containing protein n=1 Tax=Zasmidium cellare ATCC 36951 TaxID=1080233 RepID=A0A6A6C8F7_ZASCE|nr:uncharacterized protein M409DRAFT_68412 [Zasmidium cellare ATCC 36951]KAF2163467.1 hypothetical protein M409DRAFT_68412 [Zasmidium cellare ATCC 36951]